MNSFKISDEAKDIELPSEWIFKLENIGSENGIYSCFYCGLFHKKVECGGVFYCPNPRCSGPGAAWFRQTLKSYKNVGNNSHEIDPIELEFAVNMYISKLEYNIRYPINEYKKE